MKTITQKSICVSIMIMMSVFLFAQDLLQNGNFESWTDNLPDNWTVAESVSKTNPRGGIARSGSAAKQIGDAGTKKLGQLISGITPGATYCLTIWYTFNSGDETQARIWCYWKNGETNLSDNANELRGPNGGYLDYVYYYGEDFHAWKEYSVEVIAPALANSFYFEVETYIAAEVYYDDFSFVLSEIPAPITLSSFTATTVNGTVELVWETASETNNARFVIYRNGEAIGSVEGAGTTTEPHTYTFVDDTVVPGVAYTYVLADVDYANTETKYDDEAVTVTLDNDVLEADFVVGAAYPNPFNPTTVVPVNLAMDATVRAQLYDITGRPLQELHNGTLTAGSHALTINGANLSTGIYFVRIGINNALHVQKIALMK